MTLNPISVDDALAYADDAETKLRAYGDKHSVTMISLWVLATEVRRLRTLLGEAATDLADWGAYAGEYFIEKHDLAGDVARYRSASEGRT